MSNPFKSQKPPPPAPVQQIAPLPPAPERSDAETEELAEEQRRRFGSSRSGRASTYLSGGGLSSASSAVRYLGGSAAT